jgi:hypothetical protein
MRKRIKRFLGALLLACVGCGTTPTPTPTPVPDVGNDYSLVCKHLADLGCAEGAAPECAVAFGRIQEGRMSDLAPVCLMAAQSPAAARACGSVLCE